MTFFTPGFQFNARNTCAPAGNEYARDHALCARADCCRDLARYANDSILLLDGALRVADADDRALETGGWSHPEPGPVEPDTFKPLAGETGLIDPVGKRVLGERPAMLISVKTRDA